MKMKTKFYNWQQTLTYNADVTMIIGARGIGKTYGLRVQFLNDFINKKWRFCEVCRFQKEQKLVSSNYFSRLEQDKRFKDYMFKTTTTQAFIAKKPKNNNKPVWQCCGYFVALSNHQQLKKQTFSNVVRFCFDEAVLDKKDIYHRYLTEEFEKLASIIDTVSRERADTQSVKPHIYLLGNSLDLLNPYFKRYKIGAKIKQGYSWHSNKEMLLHYVTNIDYSQSKSIDTVAGRMLAGTDAGKIANLNEFKTIDNEYIENKPNNAEFMFGIIYNSNCFGCWSSNNLYYINSKIPNNTTKTIFSLTLDDASINYKQAKRAEPTLKAMFKMFDVGYIRFVSTDVYLSFNELLLYFGYR